MSSNPQKQAPKMCKSPKSSSNFQMKPDKIILNEYENLNTNCTTIGSNNLHLVKKPQIITNMSPAYSNPSPSYPQSPYNSPAGMKSPSPQSMKPPTPQPNTFPVMQIIHNNHLLARPIQTPQQQNIIKLKPHLNILPKPAASPQPSPKPSVSPQIVIPTNQQATIMPTAQPLLLPQMPVITTPGVQFILRPQTKIPTQMQTATATPQGLIIQPTSQPVLQIQPPRSQPLVRVLNGVQLATPTTTYVTHLASPSINHHHHSIPQNAVINAHQQMNAATIAKKKPKKKKQKLDLANIMKLSGIGDEDDIQFESDTSQSESEPNSVHSQPNTPQPQPQSVMQPQNVLQSQQNIVQTQANILQSTDTKKIGNIQISALPQPTINAAATPLVQVLNQSFQGGVIPTSQAQGIPFNPFIAPNFTINNGLMVQRSGGYKLTLGEDGRLLLQHDPNLNQDLQSQLLLQNLFGLNGLILQPSMDQQVHSQTVQTIQQQSVQTIQQQTVQSQTIQTVQQQTVQPQSVQHSLQTIQQTIQPQIQAVQPQTVQQTVQQTIQHQTVQSQPLSALQQHAQPMQIVQPQPIQNLNQSIQSQTVHSIQSQVQPSLHSIQSQIQGQIQSQIQGQIQSILQSQLHSQNMSQATPTLSLQSQPIQTVQSQPVHSQPLVVSSQPISIQSQPISIQSQPISIQSQPVSIHSQPSIIQQTQSSHPHIHHVHHPMPNNPPPQAQIQNQASQIQQSVQSQGIQTVHSQPMQTIQSQPVLKVQPFQKTQPPVQTVHPQPVQTIHHQPSQTNENQNPPPASYVVNLTPEQLEQLKSNGQVTVNGQTIYMQRTNMGKVSESNNTNVENKVKLSPKSKPVKKITKITNTAKVMTPEVKTVEKTVKDGKSTLVSALQTPSKHIMAQNRIQVQPQQSIQPISQKQTNQPSALIPPSIQTISTNPIPQPKIQIQQKVQVSPSVQNVQTTQTQPVQNHSIHQAQQTEINSAPGQEVDRLLGQIIEESNNVSTMNTSVQTQPPQQQQIQTQSQQQQTQPQIQPQVQSQQQQLQVQSQVQQPPQPPPQRVHTIQLTPQKQQHLKSIQLQIQTLTARFTPGDIEMQNALSMLFQEQQKILASGKLLPPDKVHYHNNQLTIVNPSSLSQMSSKCEQLQVAPSTVRSTTSETISSHQVVTSQSMKISPTTTTTDTPHTIPASTVAVHHPISTPQQTIGPRLTAPTSVQQQQQQTAVTVSQQTQPQQNRFIPSYTKAQLIEQQLSTDQNGAVKPDIHSPFKDKADACKRLVRYHCFDQPVLSIKDLNKADEIFELTAKHFIDKFSKMVDKYRFLRLRESMRQVQTSELMMLDRLFLAEEQQSLIRLRQDVQEAHVLEMTPSLPPTPHQVVSPEQHQQHSYPSQSNSSNSATSTPQSQQAPDDYDEWACIQKELGCLPQTTEDSKSPQQPQQLQQLQHHPHQPQYDVQTQKRAATCDSRLETLKKFRVDKHHVGGKKEPPNEIVVSKGYAKMSGVNSSPQNSLPSSQSQQHHSNSSNNPQYQMHHQYQHLHGLHMPQINSATHGLGNSQGHSGIPRQITQVHNSLQHQRNLHGSNVHLQNSQHHFSMQHIVQTNSGSHHHHQQQITHTVHHHVQNTQQSHQIRSNQDNQHNVHGSQSTSTYNVHGVSQTQNSNVNNNNNHNNNSNNCNSNSGASANSSSNTGNTCNSNNNSSNRSNSNSNKSKAAGSGTENNIIDEQVQSAIDSILNLQQSLDLEDTVNSMLS
ncbi:hypothetical protein AMK59_2128 [Oryctes borbonicus]|uniref:GLTSCR protein conserved domain-containing protein n=1 Tax=Oryctes borbonicus TaxID=1629725 RepID=A0A0T6BCE5_9SCAR|nr:hypothetical protein AMK59_2128 [Oryctes borbonicus]